ncbi:heme ABC exporter ATP-binding protein CcmA [Altererythrobacter aerius]|uniref:Heme ABC exporter ATP-binding protein CcmA n=1 Tax=Tsuneonella aeria TaxID=1837929 RepID=A0A6I4TB95_9SPHN|nr:heme ABC exporter ATP-binding protein CcmA [Tsuneonella aeria]MXO74601.1 heme ABC exporter ATP-binding protein CcmA [Tsuneonella aeria]
MQPRLAVQNLACRRGDRLLFAGLSFALAPGEAMQIAGPNGTGKSSLLRIVAGLLPAFDGMIEREGAVALVDERPALDEHRTTGEGLAFWRRIDAESDRHDTRLGLDRLADIPFAYLSTGQRKRAALARMAGQGAPIWLLDEPLNGLDTAAVRLAEALVADHCAAGGIALVASHQPFTLAGMARIDLAGFAA